MLGTHPVLLFPACQPSADGKVTVTAGALGGDGTQNSPKPIQSLKRFCFCVCLFGKKGLTGSAPSPALLGLCLQDDM